MPAHTDIYTYSHTLSLHDALPICSTASVAPRPMNFLTVSGVAETRCSSAACSFNTAIFIGFASIQAIRTMTRAVTATVMIVLRSEEHTSELQSLMRISYAVFCLKKKITKNDTRHAIDILV